MKQKNIFLFSLLFLFFSPTGIIAQRIGFLKDPNFVVAPSTPIILEKELEIFNDDNSNGEYLIIIGVDVPNNKKPMKVSYRLEPGHVFLILQKIMARDTLQKVFGFYPLKTTNSLFKKDVESQIKDNSKRDHDVELSKNLTKGEFQTVLNLALLYSKNKYHLNKFNCYDYVLNIFNAVAGTDTLPCIYIRYPFFFGKGGSPCSLSI